MDFQTRFVLCSAPVFLRGRAFLPILPPQTSPQSISRCRASSSYALHIQVGVCKLVSTNILYSIRYPRSCQAPRIAFKIISDDFSRLLYGSKKRAKPAFTSAEVRHTSKSCSRGRFYAISYTLKEKASHQMGDLKKSANRHSIIGTFLFLPASASGHRTLCESSASAPKCARLCAQPNHTAAARERASRRTH